MRTRASLLVAAVLVAALVPAGPAGASSAGLGRILLASTASPAT